MLTMYPGMVNSPITELAAAIDDVQTTITVVDGTKLPDAPNLAMIGLGENTETILYTQKDGNVLSGVTRGFQGIAKAWPQGTRVARFFAAYDQMAIQENIKTLDQSLAAHLNDFASKNQFGHVKIGAGLDVQEGVISNGIKSIYGAGTRAAGLAGDQDFVVGFRPRFLIVIASQTLLPGVGSWGFASDTSQSSAFGGGMSYQHLRDENYFGFSELIFLDYGDNNYFKATLKSWNDNGFTLAWETVGTVIEGQVNIRFLAVGW